VSVLPESGGYGNTGLYADLTWNPREKRPAPGMDVLALGVFTGITFHEDVYSSSSTVSGGPRGGAVKARTSPLRLSQYDYGVYASAGARGLLASARLTLTSYGEDIAADSRSLPLEIGSFETSGFPDRAWSLRLRCPALPLSPEAAYSRNYYLLDRPSSGSWRLGVSWPASFAELSAGWESFDPGGGAGKERYYSFGLSRSF